MKRTFTFLILLLAAIGAKGQHRPQYSLYMMNNYLLNPAISGIEDYADIKLGYRNQWSGIEGAPETFYLSAHMPIGKKVGAASNSAGARNRQRSLNRIENPNNTYRPRRPHHGVGGMIMADNIGPFRKIEANVSYAYHIPVAPKINLALGIAGGIVQNTLRSDEISFADPNDNSIGSGNINQIRPDLTIGGWAYSEDFYVGFSAAQLLRNMDDFGGIDETDDNPQNIHYFLTGAYRFQMSRDFDAIPSVLIKHTPSAPVAYDLNLLFSYIDRVWAGGSYRSTGAVVMMAKFSINYTFDLGYAYDYGSKNIYQYNNGSHEVVLGIRLKNKMKVLCPQNLW
jgi:type IX secretion system PorP/SprF family membrane protein